MATPAPTPSPQPSGLHALCCQRARAGRHSDAAGGGFHSARPGIAGLLLLGAAVLVLLASGAAPAPPRDGLSGVAIRRLPGSRDGRRPVPRLCEPATAAPCRLGLPRLEQRPGRNGRSAGAKRGGQRRPRLKPSFPRRAGCAEIRHDKGRDGQEIRGVARPRRTAPLDVPRNGPADGRGCGSEPPRRRRGAGCT